MKIAVTTNPIERNLKRASRAEKNGTMIPASQSGASKKFTERI